MIYLEYDNSFEGLLTAIFEIYAQKIPVAHIRKTGYATPLLFTETLIIATDDQKAERVWKKLYDLFGKKGVRTLWKAWLSEDEDIDDLILETVRYGIELKKNVLSDFGNIHVIHLQQLVKSVGREKHRMEAFVRFQLTRDGLYYAVISPDYNVLPLIAPHFESRYADQRWLIFDSARKYGIHYDLSSTEFIDLTPNEMMRNYSPVPEALGEREDLYQDLWNDYFRSTNIPSRKNMKLHTQHVPKRYWKYLTEKTPRF